jgi:galactokinase
MDQFIAARGQAGHALLIDCRSLEATSVPLDSSETVIAICDTGVKHNLASSEYNRRREECEQGVKLLREFLPGIAALRDVSEAEFALHEDRLPEVVRRRCRHVITENERTLGGVAALRQGDLKEFGELMFASHESLRHDYEVSCDELDTLVRIATDVPGVYGARMTGGGFGGCTVNLVRRTHLEEFQQTILCEYQRATNRDARIYISEAAGGAEEIKS